jgi:hypothetical protein
VVKPPDEALHCVALLHLLVASGFPSVESQIVGPGQAIRKRVTLDWAARRFHLPQKVGSRWHSRLNQSVAAVRRKAVSGAPKAAHAAKTTKAPQRPPRSSRAASRSEKLVCRYCGSDDLAPSFEKRRDARCRACFKKRYGAAPQDKKTTRTRKTKAVK